MKSFGMSSNRLNFPAFLWVSSNYYNQTWCTLSHRRLRNTICFMEWGSDITDCVVDATQHANVANKPTASDQVQLEAAYGIVADATNQTISVDSEGFISLMSALDIDTKNQVS